MPVGRETYHNSQSRLRQAVSDVNDSLMRQVLTELKVLNPRPLPLPEALHSTSDKHLLMPGQAAARKCEEQNRPLPHSWFCSEIRTAEGSAYNSASALSVSLDNR